MSKEIEAFEADVEKAFNGIRALTQKYDIREALLKKLKDLQSEFIESGKAAIKAKS